MKNVSLFVIVLTILFFFSGVAQTNILSDSTKSETASGITFKNEIEYRVEDSSYTDIIQLFNLTGKAQALQFRILINKAENDSAILIFKDIQKGADIQDPGWMLDYNVFKDSIAPNGASRYEIYVVLYNSNQNGGLSPGNHYELIKVNYKTAKLPDMHNDIKSSMKISHAEASTFNGFPINISPTRNDLKIYLKSKITEE